MTFCDQLSSLSLNLNLVFHSCSGSGGLQDGLKVTDEDSDSSRYSLILPLSISHIP